MIAVGGESIGNSLEMLKDKVEFTRKHTTAFEIPLTSPGLDRLASCENIVPRSQTLSPPNTITTKTNTKQQQKKKKTRSKHQK